MSVKRIIPCMDIKGGQVVKGTRFKNIRPLASPVDLAARYCREGADELVFYDIAASVENRQIFGDLLQATVKQVTVPLIVGGGIASLNDMARLKAMGADKFSINTGAIRRPEFITEAAKEYGSGQVIISADVKRVGDNYHVFTAAGMEDTGLKAIDWLRRCVDNGAGQVVLNAIDADGVKQGYDLPLLMLVCDAVPVPVIASGGAGSMEDFVQLFQQVPKVSAGLAASVFHMEEVNITALKQRLREAGIGVSL